MALISKEIFSYSWEEVQCPKTGLVQLSPRFWRHMMLLHTLRIWWGSPLPMMRGFLLTLHLAGIEHPRLPDQVKMALPSEAQHLLCLEGPPRFASDISVLQPAHKCKTVRQAVGVLAAKAESLGFTGIGMSDGELHLDLDDGVQRWDQRSVEGRG